MEKWKRDILEHSLGAISRRPGFRNHFATEPDDPQMAELVADGLMVRGCAIPGGLVYFHVTESGQAAVGIKYDPT